MAHTSRCETADPDSRCECSCGGEKHGIANDSDGGTAGNEEYANVAEVPIYRTFDGKKHSRDSISPDRELLEQDAEALKEEQDGYRVTSSRIVPVTIDGQQKYVLYIRERGPTGAIVTP